MKKPKRKSIKKSAKKPAKKTVKTAAKRAPAKRAARNPARKNKSKAKARFQNPFIWHDLMTTDVEAAKKFYSEVIGWTFTVEPPDCHVANAAGIGMGGIMKTPDHLQGMPSFWSGYIYTPHVDKTCAAIKKAGGTIHREPWDVPGVLRMAVVADADGAMFNVMQPLGGDNRQMAKSGSPGTVGWNELYCNDEKKALRFYQKLFGWTKGQVMPMGDMGDYVLMNIGGQPHVGIMRRTPEIPMPVWGFYFVVPNLTVALDRVVALGGKVTNGPMEVPGGQWAANAMDSQGAHFGLLSDTK